MNSINVKFNIIRFKVFLDKYLKHILNNKLKHGQLEIYFIGNKNKQINNSNIILFLNILILNIR